MAVGFPAKTDFATGDVLTATNVNDITGTLNLLKPTAKGMIFGASAANTPNGLAVGSDGSTIMADSATTSGLRYVPIYAAGRNKIINGDMSIAQRGTSVSVGAAAYTYTLDRFKVYSGNTATTVSQNTSAPTGFSYSLKLQRPNANTGTNALSLVQIIETANCMALQGQAVTVSFYVKKGANYSGGNVTLQVLTGTGTDQGGDPYSFTGLAVPINDSSYSPTTGFVRVSYGGTIAASAKEIAISLAYTPTGTAGADDALYITGLQLEIGSGVTPFTTTTNNSGGELALCQRYFAKSYLQADAPGASTSTNSVVFICPTASVGSMHQNVRYPVTMRATPTVTFYDQVGASGKVYKGANGKTSDIFYTGDAGFAGGTTDATSATLMGFQYTANAEL
jgi:hypothetical protein